MSVVMHTVYEVTGIYIKTLFSPRLFKEVIVHSFDTNSDFINPELAWLKAKNEDLHLLRERVFTCH